MTEETWTQPITKIEPNKVAVRGYRIDELMGRVPFGHIVYLVLKGELPSEAQGRVMDAILVSSVDHGATVVESFMDLPKATKDVLAKLDL